MLPPEEWRAPLHKARYQCHLSTEQAPLVGMKITPYQILIQHRVPPGGRFRVVDQRHILVDRKKTGDIPLQHWMRILIIPVAQVHETELRVDRNSRGRMEHLHELFVPDALFCPRCDVAFRLGTVYAIGTRIEKGETVLILTHTTPQLHGFPALHRIPTVGVAGIPGSLEPSIRIRWIKEWKRQPSSVLSQVACFVQGHVASVFDGCSNIFRAYRQIAGVLD